MYNNTTYCQLENLNHQFNNKQVFKCSYCGLTVALDDPNTKIMCFKKIDDIAHEIHKKHTQDDTVIKPFHTESDIMEEAILDNIKEKAAANAEKAADDINNICNQEEIENRLSICSTCEYFKDSSCLLCGCTIVREANHKNKLAHKDQKCPVDKWGPILPSLSTF